MIQLVYALEALAREQGVIIQTNSEVTSIVVKDGKVTGVQTTEQQWDADVVVAATDMPFVETQLLPKEYQTWPEEYWKKRTMGISSLLIYLGLNTELKGTVHHSMYFSRDWRKNFAEIFEKKILPEDPSFYISIRSKTDRLIVPPNGEEVVVLVPLGSGTKVSKAQLAIYAEKVIHRLEHVLGQRITPHIVVKELFGPQEFAKTYNAFEGTALGLSHTLGQSLWWRPQNRSQKVDGLFYAGQYTNPGVGVPMALISAELVAGMIAPQSESANAIFERGSVTYYYSSLFFRGQTKTDVFDLYAYVRTVDDCVDILPAQVEKFESLWAQTQDAWHGKSVESDVVTKFVQLAKRKKFSWEWIDAFWTAMRSDLHKTSYRRFAELERYMYGSAEVIGLMMSRILNLPKEAAEAAQLQGKAMQYVNFIRDVLEDKELGRNYLGYDEKTAKDPVAWSAFVRKEIAHYREVQRQAEQGYRFIPRRYLIPIRTAAEMYKWTADQIEKNPMIVWQKKIKPSKTRVITQLLKNCLR
jgi:phytoene synthase